MVLLPLIALHCMAEGLIALQSASCAFAAVVAAPLLLAHLCCCCCCRCQLFLLHQVRDVVEPALKPGDSTLQLLGTLTPLIRRLGPAADPSNLKNLPLAAAAVWALYTGKQLGKGPKIAVALMC